MQITLDCTKKADYGRNHIIQVSGDLTQKILYNTAQWIRIKQSHFITDQDKRLIETDSSLCNVVCEIPKWPDLSFMFVSKYLMAINYLNLFKLSLSLI